MKTRLHTTGIGLVLLFLLGSLHTASAFYDPGMQHWINLDPLESRGLKRYVTQAQVVLTVYRLARSCLLAQIFTNSWAIDPSVTLTHSGWTMEIRFPVLMVLLDRQALILRAEGIIQTATFILLYRPRSLIAS